MHIVPWQPNVDVALFLIPQHFSTKAQRINDVVVNHPHATFTVSIWAYEVYCLTTNVLRVFDPADRIILLW